MNNKKIIYSEILFLCLVIISSISTIDLAFSSTVTKVNKISIHGDIDNSNLFQNMASQQVLRPIFIPAGFSPSELCIIENSTVLWINNDKNSHSLTIEYNLNTTSFVSDPIEKNENFSYLFSQPGNYTYTSNNNTNMNGNITVVGNTDSCITQDSSESGFESSNRYRGVNIHK